VASRTSERRISRDMVEPQVEARPDNQQLVAEEVVVVLELLA